MQNQEAPAPVLPGFRSPPLTSVGVILLLFFSPDFSPPPSSLSLSLNPEASLFTPLTELFVLRGVCGGVFIGRPPTRPLPAVIDGTLLDTSVGFEMIVA